MEKLCLLSALNRIQQPWTPVRVGQVNQNDVKLARFSGVFQWHQHQHQDELFLVVSGKLSLAYRDASGHHHDLRLDPGEMVIVPRGTEHCPSSIDGDCLVMLFEPADTVNTGDGPPNSRTVTKVRNLDDLPGNGLGTSSPD